jgi:hypothetical protein
MLLKATTPKDEIFLKIKYGVHSCRKYIYWTIGKHLASNRCGFSHFPRKNAYGGGHISPISVYLQFISSSEKKHVS